jgi:hypothetical protein
MEDNKPTAEVIDPCTYCGDSTAFGYGKFVNRLPVDDGWGCAECSGFMCDECDTQIYLDCEVRDAEGWNYHPSCLPLDQHVGDPDDPDDEGCGCGLHEEPAEVCDTCGVEFSAFGINCDCHLKDTNNEEKN